MVVKHLDPLRPALAGIRGLRAEEQGHLMTARDQEIGQFRAQPAGGKIREPAHVVERFIGRPGGDNAVHAAKLAAKGAKAQPKLCGLPLCRISCPLRSFMVQTGRSMSKIVGIDLGTTNSLVATVDSGIPLVIADAERPAADAVGRAFPAADAEPLVGHEANRVRVLKPAETVYSIKRFMGRRGAEIAQEEILVTYPVNGAGGGAVTIPIHGRDFSPEEISAEVLKKLKRDAEDYFGEPVTRAVITVPAYFNDAQRNATKRAGELAGFTVERIVNEPTAAALAYGLDRLKEKSKIAVYDLGGGTFDLSILELNEGVFQVLATNGNTRLGGDDLDKRLVDFLVETNSDGAIRRSRNLRHPAIAVAPPRSRRTGQNQTVHGNRGRNRAAVSHAGFSVSATNSRAPNWKTSRATSSPAPGRIACAPWPMRRSSRRTWTR